MVYDWEGKEATCFQMYIQENKSLEEIMEYFKTEHNFAPRYVDAQWLLTLRETSVAEREHSLL